MILNFLKKKFSARSTEKLLSQKNLMLKNAITLLQAGKLKEAGDIYKQLLTQAPKDPEILTKLGTIALQLNQFEESIQYLKHSLAIKPDQPNALFNCGTAHERLNRYEDALNYFDLAINLKPDYSNAYYNRGNVQQKLNRQKEAVSSYQQAIGINPNDAEAFSNCGNALFELKHYEEAITYFDQAITLKPDYAIVYYNRGNALKELDRLDDAIISYNHAIKLKPNYVEAYINRGLTLSKLKYLDEALENYELGLTLKPDFNFFQGVRLHTRMQICHWDNFTSLLTHLIKDIKNLRKVIEPFALLALIDCPDLHKKTAKIYVQENHPSTNALSNINAYARHSKIRIGYFSADFHNHPTMHLMAELFEYHDKNQFELFAFSFGPNIQDESRERVLLCFDEFIDVRSKSDREITLLARGMQIDIAIDLKGFTQDCRTGIFAERCAPIQVNYLGYPGTMAADYMDYLIADRTLIPEDKQQHYSEKIIYLPNSYQVNVSKRTVSETTLSRQEQGLPDTGFVFCCFNNNYKITPSTFAAWMRILSAVDRSVLWLFESNSSAVKNLRKEAVKIGLNGDRLIFAKQMSIENHLNRIQLADLFIDTLPYNAHTTASDALRMGLPVLTCIGNSFASRVSASLLNAVNLPELITSSQTEYEELAIELANHPDKLNTLKIKLLHNLPTSPLYDSRLFTKHIESAYLTIYERQQNGLVPDHIYVDNKI